MEETKLGVEELLPPTVLLQDGDFVIDVPPASVSASLDDLCSACGPLNGTFLADMPPFTGQIETTQSLPSDVLGATVLGGSLTVGVQNGLSFDPIEGGGTVTLRVSDASGGGELAEVVLDGSSVSLDPGTTVSRTVDIDPASAGGSLRIEAEVVSVGGQSATLDVSEEITVTLESATLLAGEVTVDVGTKDVNLDPVALDVGDFDPSLTDRIREGAIVLEVANPFAVSVSGDLRIGSTSKAFTIDPDGSTSVRLGYTGDELRSFLGNESVTLSGSGTATGESITVTSDQEIVLEGDLDVTLEIGGEADSALFN